MSYTITDEYHILKFNLVTDIPPQDNSLYLFVFKEDNTSPTTPDETYTYYRYYTLPNNQFEYEFHVLSSDFDIGDVLNRFIMVHDNVNQSVPIWTTGEGVTVFIDGEYYKTIHSNNFKVTFNNSKVHTIQAFYQGNNQNRMSYTPLKTYRVKQHDEPSSGGDEEIRGKWSLKFNNPSVLKNLHYNDNKYIQFKLTKGGQPIGGKTIEIIEPSGGLATKTTNSKGIVQLKNHGYNAGKYKLGAYMVDNQHKYATAYKDATIKKNDVKMEHSSSKLYSRTTGLYLKTVRTKVRLLNNRGNPMKNAKLTVYHNKQTKSFKTDKNGYLVIDCKTGTHNFKVVYSGSKNYNAKTIKFTVTVPKNG